MLSVLNMLFLNYGIPTATLFTAIATLATVYEMRKARALSIKPRLIIITPEHSYILRWVLREELTILINPELQKNELSREQSKTPVLKIKNIGQAPATNIKISWEISGENITPQKHDTSINNEIFLEKSKSLKQEALSEVPFCTSSPTTDFMQDLQIPSIIVNNYVVTTITELLKNLTDDTKKIKGPKISLHLSYSDLDGKNHNQAFFIESTISPKYRISLDSRSENNDHGEHLIRFSEPTTNPKKIP